MSIQNDFRTIKHINIQDKAVRPSWGRVLAEMIAKPQTIVIVESVSGKLALDRAARRYRKRNANGELVLDAQGEPVPDELKLWTRRVGENRFAILLRQKSETDDSANPLKHLRPSDSRYGVIKEQAEKLARGEKVTVGSTKEGLALANALRHYYRHFLGRPIKRFRPEGMDGPVTLQVDKAHLPKNLDNTSQTPEEELSINSKKRQLARKRRLRITARKTFAEKRPKPTSKTKPS